VKSLPVHRSILAIDIERSTSALRTNPVKEELRDHIYRFLCEALDYAGIGIEHCDPFEDRGDGMLALIHPADEIPKTYLLGRLIPELTRILVDYNVSLAPAEWSRRGMRLRAVIHAGEIHRDDNGYFGEALDVACRLLDAPRLKKCLQESAAPLVLVVSEEIYWGLVKHEYDGIRMDTFRPEVRVQVAGRRRQGWVHLPGETLPPSMMGPPEAADSSSDGHEVHVDGSAA
jgi:hypothetical protein